jgi:urea transporter
MSRRMRTQIMSTVPSTPSGVRARRALTHGNGLDGVLFTFLTLAGVALLIGLLVYSFQSAETSAERDTGGRSPAAASERTELGDN